jgi:hypothetical protein
MKYKKRNSEEYRRLAKRCREAACSVSAEKEQAELLARAKAFDLLAEHCPATSSEFNDQVSSLALDYR